MNPKIIIALTSAVSAATGAFIGYKLAVERLNDKYNEQMEAEIARTRAFYSKVHDGEDMSTPSLAAQILGVDPTLEEAAEAVRGYKGKVDYTKFSPESTATTEGPLFVKEEVDEAVVVHENLFEKAEDIGFTKPEDPSKPYQISMIEFAENETEYDQLEAVYYVGDNIATDDQDQPVDPMEPVFGFTADGEANVAMFGDKNVIYIRNERLKTDYQVNKHEGMYAYEVAGFTHGDETYERMNKRRRSADE